MSYNGSDIGIFVLTYNRSALLATTLRSLLSQSVSGASITVLDNASTDATEAVAQAFAQDGVRYERASNNIGWAGNLSRAQQFACRAWTLVFHDDDLLHPEYLRYVLDSINHNPRLGLVLSAMSFETAPNESDWFCTSPESLLCRNAVDFAAICYGGAPIHFGSALYRTDVFKLLKWESDLYGKIADRPFLLSAASGHEVQVYLSPLVQYRLHADQDSVSSDSGPFAMQLAALHSCYRGYLGENLWSRSGRCFLKNNYRSMRDEYLHLSVTDTKRFRSFAKYIEFMLQCGACSRVSITIGQVVLAWQEIYDGFVSLLHAGVRRLRGCRANQ